MASWGRRQLSLTVGVIVAVKVRVAVADGVATHVAGKLTRKARMADVPPLFSE
jgi:hypothetical protein